MKKIASTEIRRILRFSIHPITESQHTADNKIPLRHLLHQ